VRRFSEVPSQLLTRAILYAIERKRTRQQLRCSREFYLSLLEEFWLWCADMVGSAITSTKHGFGVYRP